MLEKKGIISIIIIAVVLVLGFVIFNSNSNNSGSSGSTPNEAIKEEKIIAGNWIDFELTDIRTGEKFKISDLNNKPVLLESFAVWCPTCTRQQREIKKLHEEVGDDVISISLDTDPNEDESRVLEHIKRNDFNWHYAIAPIEMTQSLINQFGIGIVNAPSAPVVLICNNEARKLDSGVKSVGELKEEIEKGC